MKQLLIIGAGGMGRCVYNIAINSCGYGTEFIVKGFLEKEVKTMDGYDGYPPIVADDDSYVITPEDVFVCSIGDVKTKTIVVESYRKRGAKFMSLIHKKAILGMNVVLGDGCVIDEGVHIDPDVKVGDNCLIQAQTIIGHDSRIGANVRIDSQSFLVGGTVVDDCATIYTKAMINHNVTIGKNAVVGACSFVIKSVKPGVSVFGIPAKPIF